MKRSTVAGLLAAVLVTVVDCSSVEQPSVTPLRPAELVPLGRPSMSPVIMTRHRFSRLSQAALARVFPEDVRVVGRAPETHLLPVAYYTTLSRPRRTKDGWTARAFLASTSRAQVPTGRFVARSVTVTAVARVRDTIWVKPGRIVRAGSVVDAMRVAGRYLSIPVALPEIPSGSRFVGLGMNPFPAYGFPPFVQVHVEVEDELLVIQWGSAGFDGCGGDDAYAVTIAGTPGLFSPAQKAVIWPVRRREQKGRYGLSGDFPRGQLLRWAGEMQVQIQSQSPGGGSIGC